VVMNEISYAGKRKKGGNESEEEIFGEGDGEREGIVKKRDVVVSYHAKL